MLIKSNGLKDLFPGEEDVGLGFTEDCGKGVMLANCESLAVGAGWSFDFQSLLFLFTQIQKELSFLVVELTKLLCNLIIPKQHITDLAQKPLAPLLLCKKMYTPTIDFNDCF